MINSENRFKKIIEMQKPLCKLDLEWNLTKFFTQDNLQNIDCLQPHRDEKIKDLLMDKNLSVFSQIIKTGYDENSSLWNIVSQFRRDCSDIFEDKDYKKRYTRQLVIGMACLEWVPENIIDKIYGENVFISREMQDVLQKNNLTFMDLTARDVLFSDKDKQLFLYTMLFLHDWENRNTDKARESWYYKINEWWVEFKQYGIKSFEQAFNCGWQIYNEFFWDKDDKKTLPHYTINSIDDIYSLYSPSTTIDYNWKKVDSHTLAGILNITRSLLHIQAHKHLDYIRWELHDPESFVKYQKGQHWKDIYGAQIDEVRDWEVAALWNNELSYLNMSDSKWDIIKERTPDVYSANTKSWYMNWIKFNDVITTFSWRSKWLKSWVMKLINDPKYKKWKDVTDSLWNSFYVKNKEDWLKVWLWLIEQLPEKMIDGARLDIKWTESWDVFIKNIAENNKLYWMDDIKKNLKKYWISEQKLDLLFRNKSFKNSIEQQLNKKNLLKNGKTVQWYEEFKIVTIQGTEYQISERKDNTIMNYNEFGLWNHGVYNIKKLIELLLRSNNHTMKLWHDVLENIIESALNEEENYLREKWIKSWIINSNNTDKFNPWNAISNQLVYNDWLLDGYSTNIDEKMFSKIEKGRYEFFVGKKRDSRQAVKEHIYNMIQKNYIWSLRENWEYFLSKPFWNQRSLVSQLRWYEIYKQQEVSKALS